MYKIISISSTFIVIFLIVTSCCNLKKSPSLTEAEKNAAPGSAAAVYIAGKKFYDLHKFNEAAPHIIKAANMGHSNAQMLLGKMHNNGCGVPHNHGKARKWHKKAAAQGNQESMRKLKGH